MHYAMYIYASSMTDCCLLYYADVEFTLTSQSVITAVISTMIKATNIAILSAMAVAKSSSLALTS